MIAACAPAVLALEQEDGLLNDSFCIVGTHVSDQKTHMVPERGRAQAMGVKPANSKPSAVDVQPGASSPE